MLFITLNNKSLYTFASTDMTRGQGIGDDMKLYLKDEIATA